MRVRFDLHWNFPSKTKDGSDIHRCFKEVGHHYMLCWKSVNIRGIPESTGKISNVMQNIIEKHYFWDKSFIYF